MTFTILESVIVHVDVDVHNISAQFKPLQREESQHRSAFRPKVAKIWAQGPDNNNNNNNNKNKKIIIIIIIIRRVIYLIGKV